MVSLTAVASSPYTKAEREARKLFVARITRHRLPSRMTACLPWSNRPAARILEPAASDRLERAIQTVRMLGSSRTILLDELGSLWVVHVDNVPGGDVVELTWRFICQE